MTIEEREEYEPHIAAGSVVWAGVDYALRRYPHIGAALPALGYDDQEIADLQSTVTAAVSRGAERSPLAPRSTCPGSSTARAAHTSPL